MLRYLLDEHISHVVAEQLSAGHSEVSAVSIHHWRGGKFRGRSDALILEAAAEDALTLVTYDVRSIIPTSSVRPKAMAESPVPAICSACASFITGSRPAAYGIACNIQTLPFPGPVRQGVLI